MIHIARASAPISLIWASMSVYHILHTVIAFQVQHLAAE
jgi:hypothetical protein